VQGDSHVRSGNGRRYLATLAVAHVASATVVVLLLAALGRLVAAGASEGARTNLLAAVALVAAAVDLAAAARRRMAPGLRRQTPKRLAYDENAPWWLTPFIWGADTGMMWSTFRVTSGTWLVFLGAAIGLAPAGAGLAYGLAFAVPLAVSVLVGSGRHIGRIGSRFAGRSAQAVQVVGAAVMAAMASTILSGWSG
jgi:hypothetical protein